MRHRLVWFVVGVGIVVLGHCALGAAPREAPEVLRIKVIDTVTGKAMPGVSLQYTGYSGGNSTTEKTSLGPGGTTTLTWSQVDRYHLTFSFSIGGRALKIYRTVKVTDANAASLILRIPTDRYKKPLVVTVLNAATGKPVPRARINLSFLDTSGAGSTTHEWAQTTAAGRASLNWAGEGEYTIWCTKIDGRKLTKFYVHMELTDGIWKAGKLIWKIKVPKLSARVKVFLLSKGKKTAAPDGVAFGARIVEKDKTGMTTRELQAVCKDGKVKFYGLRAGSVNRFCTLSGVLGHKHVPIDVKPWTFKGRVLDLEVTLVPVEEYRGKLTVRVIDEKGAPVEGAVVHLTGTVKGKGWTNSAGVTAWGGLRIGRYSVSVQKDGHCTVARYGMHMPGADEVAITLAKAYSLGVRVLDQDGKPTVSVRCIAQPLSQMMLGWGARLGEKGRGRLEQLHKGYYLVMAGVGKGGGTIFERDRGGAVVDAATAREVSIRLRKAHPVRIKLTAAKGTKVPAKPLFTLVSPEANDLLWDRADKVMLVGPAYIVYLRMAVRQYVLLGKRTVTGAETITFDLKGVNMDKANWVSNEKILRLLLPKARRATRRPTTNRAATRASK